MSCVAYIRHRGSNTEVSYGMAGNSYGLDVATFIIYPGSDSSSTLDIPAVLQKFKERWQLDRIGIINVYVCDIGGDFCRVVPFDPADWECERMAIAQVHLTDDRAAFCGNLAEFCLEPEASLSSLTHATIVAGSVSQQLIDKLVDIPRLRSLKVGCYGNQPDGLRISAPANTSRMEEWAFDFPRSKGHTAEDWQGAEIGYAGFRGFDFSGSPPLDLLTSRTLVDILLEDCNVDTGTAKNVVLAATKNSNFSRVLLSHNSDITELPFFDEEAHYHVSTATFGHSCGRSRGVGRDWCQYVHGREPGCPSHIAPKGMISDICELYPHEPPVYKPGFHSFNINAEPSTGATASYSGIVEAHGLNNLNKTYFPALKGINTEPVHRHSDRLQALRVRFVEDVLGC